MPSGLCTLTPSFMVVVATAGGCDSFFSSGCCFFSCIAVLAVFGVVILFAVCPKMGLPKAAAMEFTCSMALHAAPFEKRTRFDKMRSIRSSNTIEEAVG